VSGAALGTAQARLKIDFSQTNGAVEPGYQGYFASDKNTATFTAQSYQAVAHDVYLGTDSDDIDDGMTTSAVYRGRRDANSFDLGRLELGQMYYWRVDEMAADGTVTKGRIWSFTVEPVSIPLTREQITATASSSNSSDEGPERTIDGSGLNADNQHSVEMTEMWLSNAADPNAAWVQYAFDRVYQLQQMLVWNHNSAAEPLVGFGIKEAAVAYSVDGTDWTTLAPREFARASGKADYQAYTTVEFGAVPARYVRIAVTSNWGTLQQSGLSEVRFLAIPATAREPQPVSGAAGVDPRVPLSWRAGRAAGAHQVYLSVDGNEVVNGTAPVYTVSEPRLEASGLLGLGRTYYWKVNEVNDLEEPTTWEGEVWSFSTVALLPVDDMESYNDAEDEGTCIYQTWLDGWDDSTTGSQVGYIDPPFAERTTVHNGVQSMPFYYDNTTTSLSEATRTFDEPHDWTRFGVKALTLWFYGDPTNKTATMYVKLNGRKVAYDGDPGNLLRRPWHLWYIELSRFTGADLQGVTDLTIGFEGGTGLVLFDDFALSPLERQLVTPVPPDNADLVSHYAFEGNVNDSTGAHPATVVGAPQYVAGPVGQAVQLDGVRDYVSSEGTYSLSSYTAALWFRVEGGTGARDLFSLYDELVAHGILLEITGTDTVRFLHRAPVSATTPGTSVYSTSTHADGEWYHVAGVKSATTMTLYINGELAASAAESTLFDKNLTRLLVGMLKHTATTGARYLPGAVDDLYFYGRALSQDEVAWPAGRTVPFDKP
jgi:hypothetical protein